MGKFARLCGTAGGPARRRPYCYANFTGSPRLVPESRPGRPRRPLNWPETPREAPADQ
jgi:hypothetical protein